MSTQDQGGSYVIDENGDRVLIHRTKDPDQDKTNVEARGTPPDVPVIPQPESLRRRFGIK